MEIKTVAVLGANGTMGRNIAAIFASFGKAKVFLATRIIVKPITDLIFRRRLCG